MRLRHPYPKGTLLKVWPPFNALNLPLFTVWPTDDEVGRWCKEALDYPTLEVGSFVITLGHVHGLCGSEEWFEYVLTVHGPGWVTRGALRKVPKARNVKPHV